MPAIDLNCDMGESSGTIRIGNDEAIMQYVSSVNIACGYHAGDAFEMQKTIDLAIRYNVSIGAHPGFPDLLGFGRREMKLSTGDIFDIVTTQVNALKELAEVAGTSLHHVKPHGALYNMAAKDRVIANSIAKAVANVDQGLVLYGLAGSHLIYEAKAEGLKTASEVFADRTYQDDGSLTSRSLPGAMITDPQEAALHAWQMVGKATIHTVSGKTIPVLAETICIHGDTPNAEAFARAIHLILKQHHVSIRRP